MHKNTWRYDEGRKLHKGRGSTKDDSKVESLLTQRMGSMSKKKKNLTIDRVAQLRNIENKEGLSSL